MRAVAASLHQFSPGQQRFDLRRCQRVAGFYGGFAAHHVEDFVQQFFTVQVEQFLLAAF
jgi:hypothetical protein